MKVLLVWSKYCAFLTLLTFASLTQLQAGEISKSFDGITKVRIKTTSGDCDISRSTSSKVEVLLTFTYEEGEYEPELEQRGSTLMLSESFFGRNVRGHAMWRITVPEKTDIEFSTASGNLKIKDLVSDIEAKTASGNVTANNLNGRLECGTASGDIEAENIQGKIRFGTASGNIHVRGAKGTLNLGAASGDVRTENLDGEFEFGTASGNIRIRNAKGAFDVGAASGDVDATDIELTGKSEFGAASGDVELTLNAELANDIEASTASGNVTLSFNGKPIRGFIEMTANTEQGKIRAPFDFDKEETYTKGDQEYVTKTVQKGTGPNIKVSTASGTATLRE